MEQHDPRKKYEHARAKAELEFARAAALLPQVDALNEHLKLVDGQGSDISGEPVILVDEVTVDGVKAIKVTIPHLLAQRISFGGDAGLHVCLRSVGTTGHFVEFLFSFVGHQNSNICACREPEQSNPGTFSQREAEKE
ncbi:MAG: hypothetical protein Q7P63_01325 [Verrucomicrobiota bacterium JB022]|nr:hypothetical protein [Verrucomicrobiota bacterium JB022]